MSIHLEVEVVVSGVQGHPQLHSEFKVSLTTRDPIIKQNKTKKPL